MRAVIGIAAAALALGTAACGGGDDPPPVPRGFVEVGGPHYSFARPSAWTPVEMDIAPGQHAVAFQSTSGAYGIRSQAGLGLAEEYPNSLEAAVDLAKGESRIVYRGFRITREGPFELEGARAYRVDSEYESFGPHETTIRNVDLYVQTDDGVQMNFFVRGPAEDWDGALVDRVIGSLRVS